MKLSNILIDAKTTLSKAKIEEPLRESKLLICHALNCNLEIFLLDSEKVSSKNVLLLSRALCSLDNLLSMGLDYFNNGSVGIFHKGISWEKEIKEAQKSWHFHFTPHKSLTNKSSCILLVKDIMKK